MIPGVVWFTSKTRYGFTARNMPIYVFIPFDKTLPKLLVGSSEKDTSRNVVALVNNLDLGGPFFGKASLVKILGVCGDIFAEEEALRWLYSPVGWTKKHLLPLIPPDETGISLLDVPTINIDPPGCTDIDDCISVWDDWVAITIADVSAWLHANPWLINKASQIGQTLYKDGRVSNPMLPPELSEDLCSLLPGKKRFGYTMMFKWDGVSISDSVFKPTLIINKHSYTYENVLRSDFPISTVKAVCSHIAGREVTDPHEWVEELMIFYNENVAKCLVKMECGILRGHSAPDAIKLDRYTRIDPFMCILAHSAATYSDVSLGERHWGFDNKHYCHATSPIRRWSDVVNQSIMKHTPIGGDIELLNKRSSAAKKYERDLFYLRKLLDGPPESLEGVVLDEHRVWIPDWKRIVRVEMSLVEGSRVNVSYYLDMNAPTWKKRMVLKCEDTNCREPRHL